APRRRRGAPAGRARDRRHGGAPAGAHPAHRRGYGGAGRAPRARVAGGTEREEPGWVTGTRHDFAHVQELYLPIATAVFALIVVALVVVLVRYRARPGHAARPTRDRYAVDAAVALVLAAVVAVLVVVTLRTNDTETALARPG